MSYISLKGDRGVGLDAFFHALYTKQEKMIVLLGTSSSEVTESLAKVVPYWSMLQVSFGSTSPALSDRTEFPLFYRTVAPDSSHNPARISFLKKFSWETVTAFSQNEDIYSLAVNDLVTELESSNISCRATITFAETDIKDQLEVLRDLDTRIIIGSFSHEMAPKVFCEAYRLGVYSPDYAWVVQGRPSDRWWSSTTQCGFNLAAAADGLILVSSYNSFLGHYASLKATHNSELLNLLEGKAEGFVHETYDAVWAIALTIQRVQSIVDITQFDYGRKDIAQLFSDHMGQLNFDGVSGPVAFDGSDRVGLSAFYQIQGGVGVMVGLYDGTRQKLNISCTTCVPIVWPGGQVPTAKKIFKIRTVTVQPVAFITVAIFSFVGIAVATFFLSLNLHFRKHKYIKLSSPKLNNMAVFGCILVYTAVILLGLDNATLPSNEIFSTVCTARVYLLSAGFSMAFGSVFAKTYRVHRIFTRSAQGVVKNKLLQDTQLISLICVLLVVDGLIVTLWVTVDPIERQLKNLTLEISPTERSVVYQPQIEVCASHFIHSWLGVLYIYKGLLLIVGVYMAWETRHVKIPALNDSQYIGLSVYSVVITSVLVVVLANLIFERVTLAFLTITIPILVSTTGSLCLLCVPKVHDILAHTDNPATIDPIIHSMGLKIECNTRRFLTDDRRELYFRVEVQNKVYRRELHILDSEITKLEKQLTSEVSSCSSRSSITVPRGDLEETIERLNLPVPNRGKSPSVSGGIPMLLLSVLPPVIPRASWPSEEHCTQPMRRGVTFSSESKLDEKKTITDKMNFCPRDEDFQGHSSTKSSVFSKFLNMLTARSSASGQGIRKVSAPANMGIASAFKAHMEYFAGFVPGNKSNSESCESSCNTSRTGINRTPFVNVDNFDLRDRKFSLGGLAREEISDGEDDEKGAQARSVQSLSQPRVSFSIQHQCSQPILSYKDRPKGSPRFPHRIVPTSSLNALEERRLSSSKKYNISTVTTKKETLSASNAGKCRSLEDARPLLKTGDERSTSLSPNCEVWAVDLAPTQNKHDETRKIETFADKDDGVEEK
ncbi:gamma-aminobutyric acid type B receptor subunit 3 isoform X3 [Rhodnius prolixus]|uniref:gamma-aminobutyric acid type B receptor subunit 3 isoform X3 n=1 Tax=Rhodnius prolixus TaxID=13249 RepID=UPI003D18D3D3